MGTDSVSGLLETVPSFLRGGAKRSHCTATDCTSW